MSCIDWEAYNAAMGPTLNGDRFEKKVTGLMKKVDCLVVIDVLSVWYKRLLRHDRGKSNMSEYLHRVLWCVLTI
jgi:hypothetical protein